MFKIYDIQDKELCLFLNKPQNLQTKILVITSRKLTITKIKQKVFFRVTLKKGSRGHNFLK